MKAHPSASTSAHAPWASRWNSYGAGAGLETVITVSPLLPIADPEAFFARIATVASAVVIDHFIGGDGTPDGRRTRATALPAAMAAVDPASLELAYRQRMVTVARRHLARVGVSIDGFAGRYLDSSARRRGSAAVAAADDRPSSGARATSASRSSG